MGYCPRWEGGGVEGMMMVLTRRQLASFALGFLNDRAMVEVVPGEL